MHRYTPHILFVFFVLLALYVSTTDVIAAVRPYLDDGMLGGLVFVFLLALAVVAAPVAALPLIPIASSLFGPLATSIYSLTGWTLGAVGAFLVARYLGRPVIATFMSLEKIDRYEERVSRHAAFWALVLLRMVIPVDFLSYAVGLFSRMRLGTYTLATLIGVTPFSFIFAYGSNAVVTKQYALLVALVATAVFIFGAVYYFYLRRYSRKNVK